MDPRTFYSLHRNVPTDRIACIPQESDEDTATSDSHDEWVPPRKGAKTRAEESVRLSENSASEDVENEQDTDEEVPHASTPSTSTGSSERESWLRTQKPPIKWRSYRKDAVCNYPVWVEPQGLDVNKTKSPYEYFTDTIDDDILDKIVEESNLYAVQKDPNQPLQLKRKELQDFISICLHMSTLRLSGTRKYWSTEIRVLQIAGTMSRNRFEKIKQNLHFNDNTK